eukprot:Awhi_evm1s14883
MKFSNLLLVGTVFSGLLGSFAAPAANSNANEKAANAAGNGSVNSDEKAHSIEADHLPPGLKYVAKKKDARRGSTQHTVTFSNFKCRDIRCEFVSFFGSCSNNPEISAVIRLNNYADSSYQYYSLPQITSRNPSWYNSKTFVLPQFFSGYIEWREMDGSSIDSMARNNIVVHPGSFKLNMGGDGVTIDYLKYDSNLVSTWQASPSVHCSGSTNGIYYSLDEAKDACSTLGTQCTGIYQPGCDDTTFYTCSSSALPFSQSSVGSCIYRAHQQRLSVDISSSSSGGGLSIEQEFEVNSQTIADYDIYLEGDLKLYKDLDGGECSFDAKFQ